MIARGLTCFIETDSSYNSVKPHVDLDVAQAHGIDSDDYPVIGLDTSHIVFVVVDNPVAYLDLWSIFHRSSSPPAGTHRPQHCSNSPITGIGR
jgi:hypothetical protein